MSLPDGEATALVRRVGCGVTVPPEDSPALAASVRELADSPARVAELRARSLAAAPMFSRETHARRMIRVLELALGARRSSSVEASSLATAPSTAEQRAQTTATE